MNEHEFVSEPVTKTGAIAALAAASSYSEDEDRFLTHSFLGSFGADWDFMAAAVLIEDADDVMWVNGLAGHDLQVVTTDADRRRVYLFAAPRPAVVPS